MNKIETTVVIVLFLIIFMGMIAHVRTMDEASINYEENNNIHKDLINSRVELDSIKEENLKYIDEISRLKESINQLRNESEDSINKLTIELETHLNYEKYLAKIAEINEILGNLYAHQIYWDSGEVTFMDEYIWHYEELINLNDELKLIHVEGEINTQVKELNEEYERAIVKEIIEEWMINGEKVIREMEENEIN